MKKRCLVVTHHQNDSATGPEVPSLMPCVGKKRQHFVLSDGSTYIKS